MLADHQGDVMDDKVAPVGDSMVANARAATEKEHNMTLWQGIKLYPKAIAWSMLISMCCAMEGYDISLVSCTLRAPRVDADKCQIGNFYAFPVFNQKYGTWTGEENGYQVSAHWQTSLSNGAQCGQILGLFRKSLQR
jgi:SP family general alpha glucoside:H+ symporter-like MFS transporter